jgi:hypothetical protein
MLSVGKPNMATTPDSDPPNTPGGPEPQTTQPHWLTPTSSGFKPEYDYLSTLILLCQAHGIDEFEKTFSDLLNAVGETAYSRTPPAWPRACTINSSGSEDCFKFSLDGWDSLEDMVHCLYCEIKDVREKMEAGAAQQRTCVLVAETHHPLALEVLGAAFDLDPGFLIRHIRESTGERIYDTDSLEVLSRAFASCITASKKSDDGQVSHKGDYVAITGRSDGFHVPARSDYEERLGYTGIGSNNSCVSCCRVSKYGCGLPFLYHTTQTWSFADQRGIGLILVAPSSHIQGFVDRLRPNSPYSPEYHLWYYNNIFSRGARLPVNIQYLCKHNIAPVFGTSKNLARLGTAVFDEFGGLKSLLTTRDSLLNPTQTLSTKHDLDLLFWAGDISLPQATLTIILPWLLAASAWRRNIEQLDGRLNHLRTIAMTNPSLETFKPIPLLRQYVADLQDALREMKDAVREEEAQAFAQLQQTDNPVDTFRPETLDSIVDMLLKQADALSLKASNEIQLVIGSVTIQVPLPASQVHDV